MSRPYPFRRVLVGLHGGEHDLELMRAAAAHVAPGGELHALHVIGLPRQGLFGTDVVRWHERLLADIGEGLLDGMVSMAAGWDAGATLTGHVREGDVVQEVVAAADELDVDLIVVGGARKTGLDATPTGSGSAGLLRHAARPLFIAADDRAPTDVVVPVNFSDLSREAVQLGARVAEWRGVPLAVVYVFSGFSALYDEMSPTTWWDTGYAGVETEADLRARARKKMEDFLAAARVPPDVPLRVEILSGVDPAREIVAFARTFPTPLVVMPSIGRRALEGFLVGNTPERVYRLGKERLLTFKPMGFRAALKSRTEAGAYRASRPLSG